MRKKEVLLLVPAFGHAEAGDGEGRTYGYVTQNKHMALNPMGFVRWLQGHWVPSTRHFLFQDILRELPFFSTIFKTLFRRSPLELRHCVIIEQATKCLIKEQICFEPSLFHILYMF